MAAIEEALGEPIMAQRHRLTASDVVQAHRRAFLRRRSANSSPTIWHIETFSEHAQCLAF
jgi:hypothetical protein